MQDHLYIKIQLDNSILYKLTKQACLAIDQQIKHHAIKQIRQLYISGALTPELLWEVVVANGEGGGNWQPSMEDWEIMCFTLMEILYDVIGDVEEKGKLVGLCQAVGRILRELYQSPNLYNRTVSSASKNVHNNNGNQHKTKLNIKNYVINSFKRTLGQLMKYLLIAQVPISQYFAIDKLTLAQQSQQTKQNLTTNSTTNPNPNKPTPNTPTQTLSQLPPSQKKQLYFILQIALTFINAIAQPDQKIGFMQYRAMNRQFQVSVITHLLKILPVIVYNIDVEIQMYELICGIQEGLTMKEGTEKDQAKRRYGGNNSIRRYSKAEIQLPLSLLQALLYFPYSTTTNSASRLSRTYPMRSEPPQSTPAYEALGTGIVLDDYKEQSSIEFPKNVALIICSQQFVKALFTICKKFMKFIHVEMISLFTIKQNNNQNQNQNQNKITQILNKIQQYLHYFKTTMLYLTQISKTSPTRSDIKILIDDYLMNIQKKFLYMGGVEDIEDSQGDVGDYKNESFKDSSYGNMKIYQGFINYIFENIKDICEGTKNSQNQNQNEPTLQKFHQLTRKLAEQTRKSEQEHSQLHSNSQIHLKQKQYWKNNYQFAKGIFLSIMESIGNLLCKMVMNVEIIEILEQAQVIGVSRMQQSQSHKNPTNNNFPNTRPQPLHRQQPQQQKQLTLQKLKYNSTINRYRQLIQIMTKLTNYHLQYNPNITISQLSNGSCLYCSSVFCYKLDWICNNGGGEGSGQGKVRNNYVDVQLGNDNILRQLFRVWEHVLSEHEELSVKFVYQGKFGMNDFGMGMNMNTSEGDIIEQETVQKYTFEQTYKILYQLIIKIIDRLSSQQLSILQYQTQQQQQQQQLTNSQENTTSTSTYIQTFNQSTSAFKFMISYLRVCPIQYRRNILEHLFNYIRGCVFVNKNVILGDIKEGWVRYQGDLGRIRGMGLEGMNGMDRSRSEVFTLQMEIQCNDRYKTLFKQLQSQYLRNQTIIGNLVCFSKIILYDVGSQVLTKCQQQSFNTKQQIQIISIKIKQIQQSITLHLISHIKPPITLTNIQTYTNPNTTTSILINYSPSLLPKTYKNDIILIMYTYISIKKTFLKIGNKFRIFRDNVIDFIYRNQEDDTVVRTGQSEMEDRQNQRNKGKNQVQLINIEEMCQEQQEKIKEYVAILMEFINKEYLNFMSNSNQVTQNNNQKQKQEYSVNGELVLQIVKIVYSVMQNYKKVFNQYMGLYGQYRSLINDGGLNGDKNNDKSTNGNNKGKIMINKNIKNTNNNIPKNNNISTSKQANPIINNSTNMQELQKYIKLNISALITSIQTLYTTSITKTTTQKHTKNNKQDLLLDIHENLFDLLTYVQLYYENRGYMGMTVIDQAIQVILGKVNIGVIKNWYMLFCMEINNGGNINLQNNIKYTTKQIQIKLELTINSLKGIFKSFNQQYTGYQDLPTRFLCKLEQKIQLSTLMRIYLLKILENSSQRQELEDFYRMDKILGLNRCVLEGLTVQGVSNRSVGVRYRYVGGCLGFWNAVLGFLAKALTMYKQNQYQNQQEQNNCQFIDDYQQILTNNLQIFKVMLTQTRGSSQPNINFSLLYRQYKIQFSNYIVEFLRLFAAVYGLEEDCEDQVGVGSGRNGNGRGKRKVYVVTYYKELYRLFNEIYMTVCRTMLGFVFQYNTRRMQFNISNTQNKQIQEDPTLLVTPFTEIFIVKLKQYITSTQKLYTSSSTSHTSSKSPTNSSLQPSIFQHDKLSQFEEQLNIFKIVLCYIRRAMIYEHNKGLQNNIDLFLEKLSKCTIQAESKYMSSYYMGGGGNVSGSYGYTFGFINVSTFDSYSQSQSQRNSKIQPKIELSLQIALFCQLVKFGIYLQSNYSNINYCLDCISEILCYIPGIFRRYTKTKSTNTSSNTLDIWGTQCRKQMSKNIGIDPELTSQFFSIYQCCYVDEVENYHYEKQLYFNWFVMCVEQERIREFQRERQIYERSGEGSERLHEMNRRISNGMGNFIDMDEIL